MGNLDNKSKLSELEKAILKKWLVPVSMQGVPSLADFNKHRDNASIHFKLKAGENISITVDESSNTYTVTAQGGKFDGNLPDNDLKVGTADYAYSKGQFIVPAQSKLSTSFKFSIIDKDTGEEFSIKSPAEKWTAQRVIEYINSVSGFPATAELDHTVPGTSGLTSVYVNLTAKTAGPNYTIDSKFTIRDMVGGKAARKIYLNGVDITPATEVSLDSNAPVTSRAVALALVLKQDELEWDELPTNGSYRPVYSTGIYSALQDKQGKLTGGNGIYIDGNYIAVEASGSVTLGDLAPVSGDTAARAFEGVATLADFNAHRDDSSIHFKLAAGDNITIAKDPDTNTYIVNSSAEPVAPVPEALITHAKATWDISPELPYIALYVQVSNAAGDILLNDAFGGADTPEELASELNALEGMSSLLVFSSDGNKLIVTAVAAGEAGNGMRFGFISTQPPYPEPLVTLSGGGIVPGSLKHQHVYTLAVTADTDLSALTVKQYATCELWIDYTAGRVTWPQGLWWVEGSAPTLAEGKSYAITLRNDGRKLRAKVQYEDDTTAQS